MSGIFMIFEGKVRPWDFSGFALHIHRARSGSEVGIGLVPSFHTVISSRGHWCSSLDFDRPRFLSEKREIVFLIFHTNASKFSRERQLHFGDRIYEK